MTQAIEAVQAPLARSRACLAAARCILVRRCAGSLSLELSGGNHDRTSLADAAGTGLALLDRATRLLDQQGDALDEDTVQMMRDRIDMLHAFGATFAALGGDTQTEVGKKRLVEACNELALYLDDANEGVVESAALWQGAAYRRAGRPRRALQVLRPVIAAPASRRLGLMARLEHCRALGDGGNYVSALALCLRLNARVEGWFADQDAATRKKAMDSIRWVRVALLQGWAAQLRQAGKNDRADGLEAEAAELIGTDPYPPPAERWLPLVETIGELPQWNGRQAPPATQPTAEAIAE